MAHECKSNWCKPMAVWKVTFRRWLGDRDFAVEYVEGAKTKLEAASMAGVKLFANLISAEKRVVHPVAH